MLSLHSKLQLIKQNKKSTKSKIMKKLYILGLSLMAVGAINAQTLFSTNFSSWAGGNPSDMVGSKTSLESDSIIQISSGATYGTDLAQLINIESSHRRFTTMPLSVDLDSTYNVEVYVKGQGDLRMGLFDGDLDGQDFGFKYGAYISINSATTVMHVQSFNADTTTSLAEFMISIRNTNASNGHLQIDSLVVKKGAFITPAPPATKSIYEIQSNVSSGDVSYYKDSTVNTGGIVTAVNIFQGSQKGYFIQSGVGAYTGIYVFDANNAVQIGDSVTLTGTVDEYFEATQIGFVSNVVVVNQFNDVPVTLISTAGAANEMYEGVLCRVVNANCTALPNNFGEWTVNDGSGAFLVGDFLFPYIPTIGTAYNVTGVVTYAFSEWKIYPRNGNDISVFSSVKENNAVLTNVYPNPTIDGNVTVEVSENTSLAVLDLLGNIVISNNLNTGLNIINVSELAAGNYILKVGASVQQLLVK